MSAISNLLDLAKDVGRFPTDSALAERLQVSRQVVHSWRKGENPLPDERIVQLAELAHVNAGEWLLQIKAEQAAGATARAWQQLAKRLGAAAAVVLYLVALTPSPALAKTTVFQGSAPQMYIMSTARWGACAPQCVVTGGPAGTPRLGAGPD